MEQNYFAKSPVLGRKSIGTFYGLTYKNKSKHYKMQITAVVSDVWQQWNIDIIDEDTNRTVDCFMLIQTGEEVTFKLSDSRVYKHGYHWESTGCEVSVK
jgi:uncharacterized protein YpuA (DUF1002 family)